MSDDAGWAGYDDGYLLLGLWPIRALREYKALCREAERHGLDWPAPPPPPPSPLDAAWAEAEAALPEGWGLADLSHLLPPRQVECWEAEANRIAFGRWTGEDVTARAATPAAALRALAAKLRAAGGGR